MPIARSGEGSREWLGGDGGASPLSGSFCKSKNKMNASEEDDESKKRSRIDILLDMLRYTTEMIV